MTEEIFTKDSFSLALTMKKADGTALSLSGGVVVARGIEESGRVSVPATVTMTNAAEGKANVLFPPDAFTQGDWEVHVRVTRNGETQTPVVYPLKVKKSA